MNLSYDLVALQAIDLEIDRLERRKVTLPEWEEFRRLHQRRQTVESEHDEVSGEVRSLDLQFDKANGELQIMEERLTISEKRLFGGGMTSKETENRRLEVQSLRARITERESEALDVMERREKVSVRLGELSIELETARSLESDLGEVVRKIWGKIDAELAKLRSDRAQLADPVPSEILEMYESLRRSKGGVAAGRLEGSICGGCHLALSESERQEAAETDPARCPHCRRILVI